MAITTIYSGALEVAKWMDQPDKGCYYCGAPSVAVRGIGLSYWFNCATHLETNDKGCEFIMLQPQALTVQVIT